MTGVYISISRDIVATLGANAAIVHQQIAYAIHQGHATRTAHEPGWYTGRSKELANITGLSSDACRRAMTKLLEAGLMEKAKHRSNRTDHTLSYRPIDPALVDLAIPPNRSGDSAESGSGDSAESTSPIEDEENPPPNPLQGGGEDAPGRLFEPGTPNGGASVRKTRAQRHSNAVAAVEAVFEPWWKGWPNTIGRQQALKAFAKAVHTKGVDLNGETMTPGILGERLSHYLTARLLYHDHWAERSVEGAWPTNRLHATTFINSRSAEWDHEWTLEECHLWPAPNGHEWDEVGARRRRRRRGAVEEEIAREEAENRGR